MDSANIFDHNRVILCHFDNYSAASFFARYGSSILAPAPLPEGAGAIAEPADITECHAPEVVKAALIVRYGFAPAELTHATGFREWMGSSAAPIRIHLFRFTTFDPPCAALEPHGGIFKPISEMRGTPMMELNLLRRAFDLVMSGG
ncbi:hypothetical protein [Ferrovum myxofaciens]|jgi:hypothetical protein|uniref:Uncharacterized protein n=2 Tax=root TaxID=1 RepID=A0A8F3IJU2_9PROT|nr:hypothetical protein [Ferrovum myxofaciens]MBW8028438.1 hypothetical protein [Ferrovum sp.]KXW58907.1 hypothetical protein FEMY_05890 [Ferrovum myxofaciens]MBU6995250.1 hypothetical protein [Ferrovum myxofaciens]QKE39120.1 MAG: hypothetical protein HO273_10645 [Ferrovum myxofaciens]QKE41677.1 MAG: hypothetical protein HO274_10430 [Ferrovum myxofaciens]